MIKKFWVRFLIIVLSIVSFSYLSEGRVDAKVSAVTFEEPLVSDNVRNPTTVTDRVRSELRDLALNVNRNLYENHEISFSEQLPSYNDWESLDPWMLEDKSFAEVTNDMVLQNGETLAAHSADFVNKTGSDQTMSTASFTYTQTDSVTTSTTHSTGVSLTTSAEMKFPIASGSISLTGRYDFSTTNSVQSTVAKQWTVPSQNIKVPAGHKYNITWVLNTGVATGTTNLTSVVRACVPFKINNHTIYGGHVGDAINTQNRLVAAMPSTVFKWGASSDWKSFDDGAALRKWGTAKYTAQFGTEITMTITDRTDDNSSPVVVQEIPMNVTPEIARPI